MLKKSFIILIMCFFLGNCSQVKNKNLKHKLINSEQNEPNWIYNAEKSCSSLEICSVGEGSSFKESDGNAIKSIAGMFSTKVNSNFRINKQSFSSLEISEIKDDVEDRLELQVELVVKGVMIKNRYSKNGVIFSLASLDKNKSLSLLKLEVLKIDDEMEHYFKQSNRLYIKKLNILYNNRMLLNEKMIIISGREIPIKLSYSKINKLKFNKSEQVKLRIKTKSNMPLVLLKKIEESFTSIGYKLTKDLDEKYTVLLNFKAVKEYFKVRGFEKYTFELYAESRENTGKKLGGLIISIAASGRNQKDAFLKVRSSIIKGIEESLDKLNLK